jgi:hypothetical protein
VSTVIEIRVAAINCSGPMDGRPAFHSNDESLDRLALDSRVVQIADGTSARSSRAKTSTGGRHSTGSSTSSSKDRRVERAR